MFRGCVPARPQLGAVDGDRAGAGQLPDYGAVGDSRNSCSRSADVFGADEYPQVLPRIGWAPVNAAAVNPAS
jgi:hypothetical protein